jgi:NitT/TauT family transport system substrate-binding protein
MTATRSRRSALIGLLAAPLLFGLAACGDGSGSSDDTSAAAPGDGPSSEPVTLHLGYFPNVTHAPALVGVGEGLFEETLPDNVTLETLTFNAGPEAVEALFAGSLDITYIGPNPAINAFAQSDGEAVRIIAGSTSGGAALVTSPDITSPEQLEGAVLATPQLGNTQDVALRAYLADEGFETDETGGGDVSIRPQANADTLTQLQSGDIDGAWVPEPWVTRLVDEGGGHVLVDEADLWPGGDFVTTHIVVRTAFLEDHPDVVEAFLRGHLAALQAIDDDPAAAQAAVNDQIEAITTSRLADNVIAGAWQNLRFTYDPIASSLEASAAHAEEVGLLDPVDLEGIYDLSILNRVLADDGLDEVAGI